ncbi:8-oxo-dGDP phosphatase NUDT18-like [Saccoglossus kowalevskii]|uniref:8-oxo-dGDP phosphatase NUDT18-like n=1 Tax=Saccoglossus kowalevskii TaxID=10224 RepID=A0ABM0GZM3_SACKO|nr:PREDICTED: 8-oxo-dGDP phosphatase NUDT18-like [Saccoglossus kowalevskii]
MEDDDGIENMIRKYLRGEAPNVSHPQCDVIHKRDQLRDDEVAVLKYNVHYIVAAVLINEKGEVLMMQEAKVSCRGTWYLPAGRMERNETLEEGVKREVHEETGLEFQPSAIIFIECIHGNWVRVTFTGSVTGKESHHTQCDRYKRKSSHTV